MLSATATSAAFLADTSKHTLEDSITLRSNFLTEYQSPTYARTYTDFIAHVRASEQQRTPGLTGVTEAAARYLFKLMAYKDEYEVARLYGTGDFARRVRDTFDGDFKLKLNLAPPMFSRRDHQGHLVKREFGPWIFSAFKLLQRLKFVRGTAFDPFGRTAERRMERQLIADYRRTLDTVLADLTLGNHALAVEIARVPEHIRGYGHVKEAHLAKAKAREAELLAQFRDPLRLQLVA